VRLRAPDCLPHQVKSADAKTTLLHYLAILLTTTLIDELKGELNSLPDAKEISLSDKKSELAKLVASVEQAQQQLDLGKKEVQLPLIAPLIAISSGGDLGKKEVQLPLIAPLIASSSGGDLGKKEVQLPPMDGL
jgi:hypothetical protein